MNEHTRYARKRIESEGSQTSESRVEMRCESAMHFFAGIKTRMGGIPYRGSMLCHADICEPRHAMTTSHDTTGHLKTNRLSSRMHPACAAAGAHGSADDEMDFSKCKMANTALDSKDADQGHPIHPSASCSRPAALQRAPGASSRKRVDTPNEGCRHPFYGLSTHKGCQRGASE